MTTATYRGFTKIKSKLSPSYWVDGIVHVYRAGNKWVRCIVHQHGGPAEHKRTYSTRGEAMKG